MPTFPINAETRGSLGWLRQQVGGYLGFGYDPNTWDHEKISKLDSYINSGVQQFYFPPPIQVPDDPKPAQPHRWSFLTPVASLNVLAGTSAYDLPSTFTGVVGEITLTISGTPTKLIPIVPEEQIRQLQTNSTPSSTPLYAAVRPKASNGSAVQVYELVLYPTPSAAGTASYRFSVAPPDLDEDHPFPLGGSQYYEAILQSCLAVAEERLTKTSGAASERFMSLLQAAISWDSQSLQTTDAHVWGTENELTDLTINRAYLKRRVGLERNCGPNPLAWTHKQTQEIQLILQAGLRKFYHPPVLPGETSQHEWSFFNIRAQLTFQDGISEYELPENYALIDGPITYAPSTDAWYEPLNVINEHRIATLLQNNWAAGRPRMVAILPTAGVLGTVWKMRVYPVPDGEYTISYRYQINPTAGTDDTELLFGGQPHAQTLIEACLAASEELDGKQGLHGKLFMDHLRASVAQDRAVASQGNLGYNGDPSNRRRDWYGDTHGFDDNVVGIYRSNGTEY